MQSASLAEGDRADAEADEPEEVATEETTVEGVEVAVVAVEVEVAVAVVASEGRRQKLPTGSGAPARLAEASCLANETSELDDTTVLRRRRPENTGDAGYRSPLHPFLSPVSNVRDGFFRQQCR